MKYLLFVLMFCSSVLSEAKAPMLLWDVLLLKESSKADDKKKLNSSLGKRVKIPGYMIPLESDPKYTREFLFVPSLPACIHVPPPPPSQTIHVKAQKGKKFTLSWDPVWVEGVLQMKESKIKDYGDASFSMEAVDVRNLKQEDINEISKLLQPSQAYEPDCNGRDKYEPICAGQSKGGKK